jgi:hypothetical protein
MPRTISALRPKKTAASFRLERLEAAIGRSPAERAVRVRLKLEGLGGDASLREAAPEALEGRVRYVNGRLMLRARVDGEEAFSRSSLEAHHLPLRGEPTRQAVERYVVDQQCEQFLVEPVRKLVFVAAPFRGKPNLRYEEQNGLATGGRILQRPRPALAGNDAAFGIEIEEDVLLAAPAFANQPRLQRERPVVVEARMANEQARQGCTTMGCRLSQDKAESAGRQ